jgi:hypothetical protein
MNTTPSSGRRTGVWNQIYNECGTAISKWGLRGTRDTKPTSTTMGSTPAAPPPPTQATGIWAKHQEFMHVHLDNDTKLAYMKITSGEREVIAIKRFDNADVGVIQDLVYTPHPNVVKSFGMMAFPSHILVMHECMDTTLAQVISAPMRLDEEQIATVCSEVNLSPTHTLKDHQAEFVIGAEGRFFSQREEFSSRQPQVPEHTSLPEWGRKDRKFFYMQT